MVCDHVKGKLKRSNLVYVNSFSVPNDMVSATTIYIHTHTYIYRSHCEMANCVLFS